MKTYSKVAIACLCMMVHTVALCGAKAPKWLKKARQAQVTVIVFNQAGSPREAQGVVMGDSGFAGLLSIVLADYRIPAYIARKLPAASHGAARFLLSSLAAIRSAE